MKVRNAVFSATALIIVVLATFGGSAGAAAQNLPYSRVTLAGTTVTLDIGGGPGNGCTPRGAFQTTFTIFEGALGSAQFSLKFPYATPTGPIVEESGNQIVLAANWTADNAGSPYSMTIQGSGTSFTGTLTQHGGDCAGNYTATLTLPGAGLTVAAPPTTTTTSPPSKVSPTKSATSPPKTASLNEGQRSTIAAALVPIDKAFPLTWRTLLNVGLTLVAMMLITFPSQLFNKTLDENYDEIKSIVKAHAGWLVRLRRFVKSQSARKKSTISFLVVLVVGTIFGGLNDPTFGFNVKSLETFVAVILIFVALIAINARVTYQYRQRKKLPTTWNLHALPAGLIVAFICMIVSRLTHFEPGYLYGVIAGVVFTSEIGTHEEGKTVALGSFLVLVAAAVSWAIWTPIGHSAAHPHANAIILVADSFFGGLFVSGTVGSVISLVPLDFLPGASLYRWHRKVWTLVFGVAMFLLIQVMLLPAARTSRLGDAPFVTTIILFVVFGGLSIAMNRYFSARELRKEKAEHPDETPPPEDQEKDDQEVSLAQEAYEGSNE